jgi:hypothetical protein
MSVTFLQSAPIRTWPDVEFVHLIDRTIRGLAVAMGATEFQYPMLIARDVLDRAEYPQAFPHLLLNATRAKPDSDDERSTALVAESGWCLSPAVCYHTYAQLSQRQLCHPVIVTARGRCFRAERETSRGVRQVEFEMREIVLLGPREWIDGAADHFPRQIAAAAGQFRLDGEWVAATDPFFLPAAAGKALMQRLQKTKIEYQWPHAGGLALASINRHGTFFGTRFGITDWCGEPVHSMCGAVGLDRWAHHACSSTSAARELADGCTVEMTR